MRYGPNRYMVNLEAQTNNLIPRSGELRERLIDYRLNHVKNMDENGFFYKLLWRRTYLLDFEGNNSVRDVKSMKVNHKITVFMCTNPVTSTLNLER